MSGHRLVWGMDGDARCTCGQWGTPPEGDAAEGFELHALQVMTDESDPMRRHQT